MRKTTEKRILTATAPRSLRYFIFILTQGLRQGGGIGDTMQSVGWKHAMHSARMIDDFLFFAVMNVVFLNILFGIIIDTVAELRDVAKATR
jgi:inositol 1,4,5-triphosphate receptor type 1